LIQRASYWIPPKPPEDFGQWIEDMVSSLAFNYHWSRSEIMDLDVWTTDHHLKRISEAFEKAKSGR